ncbi:MAG: GTP-binding protein [Candidatus Lokiarchaeota archaeon]|nr:GTP-binding protein [Candidatus Lokiarchaeota archaeon]
MTNLEPDFVHKIVFLGDSGVGKTSLVQRYVYDSLDPQVGRTIGAILHVKTVVFEDETHKLVIWDLAGEQSFSELREQYCANATAAFFVIDTTRPETLESVDEWLGALFSASGKVPVVMIENKIDLESVFSPGQVEGFAESREMKLIKTSATENKNVNRAFHELVGEIKLRLRAQASDSGSKV